MGPIWFAFIVCGQFYPESVEAEEVEDHFTGNYAHLYRRPLEENSVTCVGSEFDIESIRPTFDKYRNDYSGHYYLKRLNLTDKWSRPKEMSEFAEVIYEPGFLKQVPEIKKRFESCVLEYKNGPADRNGTYGQRSKRFWDCIDPKNVKAIGDQFCKELEYGVVRRFDKWGKCVKVVPKLREKAVKCVGDKLDVESATNFIENEYFLGKTDPTYFLTNLNLADQGDVPLMQQLEDFMTVLFDPELLHKSEDIQRKYLQCVETLIEDYKIGVHYNDRAKTFIDCIAPKNFLSEGQKICSLNSPPKLPPTVPKFTSSAPKGTSGPKFKATTAPAPNPPTIPSNPLLNSLRKALPHSVSWPWFLNETNKPVPDYDGLLNELRRSSLNLEESLREYIDENGNWKDLLNQPGGEDIARVILLEQASEKIDWISLFKNIPKPIEFNNIFPQGGKPHASWPNSVPGLKPPSVPTQSGEARIDWPKILSENGGQEMDWHFLIQLGQGPNPDWQDMVDQIGKFSNLDFHAIGKYASLKIGTLEGIASRPGGKQVALLLVLQEACGVTGDVKIRAFNDQGTGDITHEVTRPGRPPVTLRVPASKKQILD